MGIFILSQCLTNLATGKMDSLKTLQSHGASVPVGEDKPCLGHSHQAATLAKILPRLGCAATAPDHRPVSHLPSTLDLVSKVILMWTFLPLCLFLASWPIITWKSRGTSLRSDVRCSNTGATVYLSCGREQSFNSFLLWLSFCKTGIMLAPTSPGRGSTYSMLGAVPTHTHALSVLGTQSSPVSSACTCVHDLSVCAPSLRTKAPDSSSRTDRFP